VALADLADVLGFAFASTMRQDRVTGSRLAVLVRFGERRFAFVISEVVEYVQLILKPLGDLLERVPNISGTAMLGTGELALVVNPADLVRTAGAKSAAQTRSLSSRPAGLLELPTILVVDDSLATRTFVKTILESAGFNVLTASDGYKALDVLSEHQCDLVLTDIQMPNMDGIGLTSTIKTHPELGHIPVILLTAMGADEDKARGQACGADAYIVKKELTQSELVETINQLL
jgi:two-component system chemotaxis sensor kinase CheA